MLFLLPIPVSLALALGWAAWASRPRRPVPAIDSVAEYRRALQALAPAEREHRELARV